MSTSEGLRSAMIARFSVFSPNPWGDGGARRTAQISEILDSQRRHYSLIGAPELSSSSMSLLGLLTSFPLLGKCDLSFAPSKNLLFTMGNDIKYFRDRLREFEPGTLFLWEATHSRYAYLPFMAKELGHRVIGLPHNLESLVPGNCSFLNKKTAPEWLRDEVLSLACCDRVFAISREDQWLLRLHGVDAGFLPYVPPKQVNDEMLKIREFRNSNQALHDLLILGTAANHPTYLGLVDRLEFFSQNRHSFQTLHVAGYGTERVRDSIPEGMNVILHGTIDNEKLFKLLSTVQVAIVHQVPTTGSLTRIPELIRAGVPVLANVNASRSFFGTPGVSTYEDDKHLLKLLNEPLDKVDWPMNPSPLFSEFLEIVGGIE